MPDEEHSLEQVLDRIEGSGEAGEVSVNDVLHTFEHRSVGVLITVFGLIAAMPVIGGIPGMSILTGTLIIIAVGQSLLGRGSLWAPGFVGRRSMKRDKFKHGVEKARPATRWVDRRIRPRLRILINGRLQRLILMIAAVLLALTFYPLAVVPWGVTAPSVGVVALGLGLIACDGLLVLFGYLLAGITVYLLYAFL